MATKVILPKQGLQMTEGTILKWLVREGESCTEGEPLFEMETDKLSITIDAPATGTLLKIVKDEGEVVPITQMIAVIGTTGEDISGMLEPSPTMEAQTTEASGQAEEAPISRIPAAGISRVFISPRAKRKASELGFDYHALSGSGPEGMILERDVLAATAARATPLAKKLAQATGVSIQDVAGTGARGKVTKADVLSAVGPKGDGDTTLLPFTGMRKIIAERMKQSLNESAQATHRVAVRMTEAKRLREILKAAGTKVSYNDIIALCTVRALLEFPMMNAELTESGILQKHFVHLGVAVAMEDGLIVPVVKNAERLSLQSLSATISDLAHRAKNKQLLPEEYKGGSFTISNLGMYGLEEFTAIINPPECGILAVGGIEDTAIVVEGELEIHPVVRLTLSYDHRIVDGAPAAEFVRRLKQLLETPLLLL